MKKYPAIPFIFSVVCFFIFPAACSPFQYDFSRVHRALKSGEHRGHYIEGVPFVGQKSGYCGPAALSSVYRFHGTSVTQEAVASSVYSAKVRGTPNVMLVLDARRRGFWTDSVHKSGLLPIFSYIDEDLPVIVMGGNPAHFMVLVGYDETKNLLIVHDGYFPNRPVAYRDFVRWWSRPEKAKYWYLLAAPRDKRPSTSLINEGIEAEKKGDTAGAGRLYRTACEKAANPLPRAAAMLNTGKLKARAGDNAGAEILCRAALGEIKKIEKDFRLYYNSFRVRYILAGTFNTLAWVLKCRGKKEEALVYVRRALDMYPGNSEFEDTLKEILKN